MDIPTPGKLYTFNNFSQNWFSILGQNFSTIPIPTTITIHHPQFVIPNMARIFETEFWSVNYEIYYWMANNVPRSSLKEEQRILMYEYWEKPKENYLFCGFVFLQRMMYQLEYAEFAKNNSNKSISEIHFDVLRRVVDTY